MPAADPPGLTATFRHVPSGPRIVFGVGAIAELVGELDLLGAKRALLLAERSSAALDPVAGRLAGHFTDVRQHVPVATARAAAAMARDTGADALLCLGGGSATGTAKAVALETGLPIVAVPLTYAGSEVTSVYGVTEDAVKHTGRSPLVVPRTVIYDPALAAALPQRVSACSAVNALAHCVAGLYAPDATPVSGLLAAEGIRRLSEGLRGLTADPRDLAARCQLGFGAYLGGTVLASTSTGLQHAICHALGGAFNLPHAETHTAVLPAVTRYLTAADPATSRRVAAALGAPGTDAATALRDLAEASGARVGLRDLGLPEERLTEAADQVSSRLGHLPPPRPGRDDVLAILRSAL